MSELPDRTQEAMASADWRRVAQLYRQFSHIVDDRHSENQPSDGLISALSEWISRTFAQYEGREDKFREDLFDVLRDVEQWKTDDLHEFHWLYKDRRLARFPPYSNSSPHRRPSPFEAAVETTRRIIDLNGVRQELAELPTSSVLGGSLSYGRFFNTRGALDKTAPSDIDLLLVVPDYDLLPKVVERFGRLRGVMGASVERMLARIPLFEHARAGHAHCSFSHKLAMWEDERDLYLERYQMPGFYLLNVHVFSREDFDFLILRDLPVLGEDGRPLLRELHEYRDDAASSEETQRAFDGSRVRIPVCQEAVDGGYVARMRVCHIDNQRFYPGTHLNLILPQFEVRWESPDMLIRLTLLGLKWKLLERLTEERRLRAFEHQVLSASHTRSNWFAPHVRRRVDQD